MQKIKKKKYKKLETVNEASAVVGEMVTAMENAMLKIVKAYHPRVRPLLFGRAIQRYFIWYFAIKLYTTSEKEILKREAAIANGAVKEKENAIS